MSQNPQTSRFMCPPIWEYCPHAADVGRVVLCLTAHVSDGKKQDAPLHANYGTLGSVTLLILPTGRKWLGAWLLALPLTLGNVSLTLLTTSSLKHLKFPTEQPLSLLTCVRDLLHDGSVGNLPSGSPEHPASLRLQKGNVL